MATAVAPRVFKDFINGEWVESRSGKAYENRNPANTDELVGMFVSSGEEDVNAAVNAAKRSLQVVAACASAEAGGNTVSRRRIARSTERRFLQGHDARNGKG